MVGTQQEQSIEPFVITRKVDAQRDVVWRAWTERERLMRWFGPRGFTMPVAALDLRPGGSLHYCLESVADGKRMWGKFEYREITPPSRMVLVKSFSDERGGLTRHPFSDTWPLRMLTTTTFDERNGRTTITVQWEPIDPTAEERQTFDDGHDAMRMGWTGTFEQLDAYLANS
jgi:uncharacterized protein YndB with AHSA1/START domain